MARDVFTVVLLEQQWMVRFHGRHSRPYATQDEAIAAAVDSAHKAGMANPDGAQVRVQEPAVPKIAQRSALLLEQRGP